MSPNTIKTKILEIERLRKNFIDLSHKVQLEQIDEDPSNLSVTVKTELERILEAMTKAIQDREHFRFGMLLQETYGVEKMLTDDSLYMKIIKDWVKDLAQAQNSGFTEMSLYEDCKNKQ